VRVAHTPLFMAARLSGDDMDKVIRSPGASNTLPVEEAYTAPMGTVVDNVLAAPFTTNVAVRVLSNTSLTWNNRLVAVQNWAIERVFRMTSVDELPRPT